VPTSENQLSPFNSTSSGSQVGEVWRLGPPYTQKQRQQLSAVYSLSSLDQHNGFMASCLDVLGSSPGVGGFILRNNHEVD
jgi:hypothetical protein